MTWDDLDANAGEVCDALDEILAGVDLSYSDTRSHLYLARDLLLAYIRERPNHVSSSAVAYLQGVADACQRAIEALPDCASTTGEEIERVRHRVIAIHQAVEDDDSWIGWETEGISEHCNEQQWSNFDFQTNTGEHSE